VDFERLIETERRNDDLLRRAREEADALGRATLGEVERRRSEAETELEAAVASVRAAMAGRRESALAEIATRARDDAAGFDVVTDEQVAIVVTTLLADLARGGSPP
jgi:hypothetical protein